MGKKNIFSVFSINVLMFSACCAALENYPDIKQVESQVQKAQEFFIARLNGKMLINENVHYCVSGLNTPVFNDVTHFSDTQEKALEFIDYVVAEAQKNNAPLSWAVSPSSQPSTLPNFLIEKGFINKFTLSTMIYHLHKKSPVQSWPKLDIHIRKLSNIPQEMEPWIALVAQSFNYSGEVADAYLKALTNNMPDTPKLEFYGAFYNDRLVGIGNLMVDADYAFIFKVATDKNYRNQGIATALLQMLLQRADELGLDYVILDGLGKQAYSINQKIGFEHVFDFDVFVYYP
jgi:GNAT superfamily N-acetyltransferase